MLIAPAARIARPGRVVTDATPRIVRSERTQVRRSRSEDIGSNQAESMAGGINDRQVLRDRTREELVCGLRLRASHQ